MANGLRLWVIALFLASIAACTASRPAAENLELEESPSEEPPTSLSWQYKLIVRTDFARTFDHNTWDEKGMVTFSGSFEVSPDGSFVLENGGIEVTGTFSCPDASSDLHPQPTITGDLSGEGSFKLFGQIIPEKEYENYSELDDSTFDLSLGDASVDHAIIAIPQTVSPPDVQVSFGSGRCTDMAGSAAPIWAQPISIGLIPFLKTTTAFVALNPVGRYEASLELKEDMDLIISSATICIDSRATCP